jgi:hypothetical protein
MHEQKTPSIRKHATGSIVLHTRKGTNEHAGSDNKLDIPNKKERDLFGAD